MPVRDSISRTEHPSSAARHSACSSGASPAMMDLTACFSSWMEGVFRKAAASVIPSSLLNWASTLSEPESPASTAQSSIRHSFSTVHSCGETKGVLEDLASLGGTALSVETSRDPQGIFDRVSDKVVLVGGVQPVRCLLQGTPEDVRASARRYAEIGYPVIAPECGVPPMTPDENLLALSRYRGRSRRSSSRKPSPPSRTILR